jgi:hypothetical protein
VGNDKILEKIEKLEHELAELKGGLKQKNTIIFDRNHSYVAIDAEGLPYYLMASADDVYSYAWHSLIESNHTTWDGLHDDGQEALNSIMEEDISSPWTIHEFNSGVDALEFYLYCAHIYVE